MAVQVARSSRQPRTQIGADPQLDRSQNLAASQEEQAMRIRLGQSFPMDGTETMEAPLPLQPVATASLPPAADWTGSTLYDSTSGKMKFSNGVDWIDPAAPQTVTLTGDVTGAGTTSIAATIANNAVTYAKLQDISAQFRILGRKTAGAGDAEECTLSEVLDFIGSAADGDILYRTGGAWARLPIGSAAQQLVVSGGLPAWATPTAQSVVPIAEGTFSAVGNLDLSVGSTYPMYEVDLMNVTPSVDNASVWLRFSQAAAFLSGASDYSWGRHEGVVAANDEADSEIEVTGPIGNAADEFINITLRLFRPGVASFRKSVNTHYSGRSGTPASYGGNGGGTLLLNTDAIDGIRFLPSSGTFSGYYAIRGYKFA